MKIKGLALWKCALAGLLVFILFGCQKEVVKPLQTNQTSSHTAGQTKKSSQETEKSTASKQNTDQLTSKQKAKAPIVSSKKSTATSKSGQSTKLQTNQLTKKTTSTTDLSKAASSAQKTTITAQNKTSNYRSSSITNTAESKNSEQKSTSKPSKTSTAQRTETVTVTIIGYNNKPIVSAANVPFTKGETYLDATLTLLKDRGIQYDVSGSGATAYIRGIDNQYEFDHGAKSGWTCKKNGVMLTKSAGITPISAGDRIEWLYVTGE